ncbi:MAG: HAD-IIA family hydrolase [candidate division Zixibacteria bacterium]|nr:HAD-IIA family hydrolase [candidate division Zixibacteria bacterium]
MINCFLIDIEGTIVKDKSYTPVEGAVQWLKKVKTRGKKFSLVSNNTTHSPKRLLGLLRSKGFELEEDNLDTCMNNTNEWLRQHKIKSCFVIGNQGLKNYLGKEGIKIKKDGLIQAVVVGLDEKINYQKLQTAVKVLVEKDACLVALHYNKVFKNSRGEIAPSVGCIVKALEYASAKRAYVLGKPSKDFYRSVLWRLKVKPRNCIFISDDPLTDLAGAKKLKIKTAFVLSGKYDRSILKNMKVKPDFVYRKISDIKV